MTQPSSPQTHQEFSGQQVLRILLFALAVWFSGVVLFITLSRVSYPFDLEWMEGGSLVQVLRLLDGKPLYVAPHLEYIPYIYPPLFYYCSALLARLTGLGWFLPLRLVSLAASVGIAALIFQSVRVQTRSAYWAFIACGFFAASFQIGGAWFDIARVDMLFVFLLLAGTFALEKTSWRASLLAGLLFTCAFFTKQTAFFVVFGLLIYVFIFRQPRAALLAGAVFLVSAGLWVWFENARSAGWFWYYIFTLPGLHRLPAPGAAYIGQPLTLLLPVCIAFGVGFAPLFASPLAHLKSRSGLWTVFGLGMLATSVLASINPGSFNNNYVPFYAAISLLFGANLPWLLQRFGAPRLAFRRALLYTLCLAQFLALLYNPAAQLPTPADLQAGQALVQRLRALDGEVLIPNHNALAILAGKQPYAHLIALQEIRGNFGQPEPTGWASLSAEIDTALSERKFAAILLDQPNVIWVKVPLQYAQSELPYSSADVFWPVTGGQTRPRYWYTRPAAQP